MSFKSDLMMIDPSKKCLEFLADRVLDVGYRGIQISQHNRYTVDEVIVILEEFYNLVGMNKMTIRNEDLSSRPSNTPDEAIYAVYTNNVVARMGRGTQDTIRKNHFVDFHRMGFIKRYDRDGYETNPYEKKSIRYVSLTQLGLDLVKNKNNTFQKNFIYTKAIDVLSHGLANDLLDVALADTSSNLSIYEFMFFISFIGKSLGGHCYSRSELTDYMFEFRSMSKFQKQAVIDIVDHYCDPNSFAGDKTNKRDFHNWKNEAQQIFMLMDQTVIFELGVGKYKDFLHVKVGSDALFDDVSKLNRSKKAKDEYFINHHISKKPGFELHHVIPLLLAKSKLEFDALDVWENLVYIDGYTHGKISQSNNKNIVLSFMSDDVRLSDNAGILPDIICKKIINIEYDVANKEIMENYNTHTIASL